MTDEEIIAVVSAHKEGKKIQFVFHGNHDWKDCMSSNPLWQFQTYEYRVAPEPRTEEICKCCGRRLKDILSAGGTAEHFPEPLRPREGWIHESAIIHIEPVGHDFMKVREVATSVKQDFDWSTVKASTQETFRKPREWWIHPKTFPDVEFEKDRILTEQPLNPAWIHVVEVLE